MSIVDKPHLQNVALGIWNKVQGKLNNYVHKTNENAVFGKTVLFDGYVGGDTLPTVGSTLSLNPSGNYVGKVAIYGGTVALRDLANGGTSGVSRQEFNIHKLENSEQHQNLQNSINTTNNNVSTQSQRITNLENNSVRLNAQNRFTTQNTFENRSPIVDKYYFLKEVYTADGIDVLFSSDQYCCAPKMGVTTNDFIYAVLLPIKNSQPGDTVEASYFTVNATNKTLTSNVLDAKTYTVLDTQYRGEYCIAFTVNKSFSYPVSFGFRVKDKIMAGRQIGMLRQDLPNQNSNNAWNLHVAPTNGQTLTDNAKFTIPYVIARRTSSEVVTRFDLANNTIPMLDNTQIAELKFLAYDAGESVEINGHTWLKCEGQTLSSAEYGELYNEIGLRFNTKEEVTIQPTSEDGAEVAVEFNLPSNNSTVGYMYICAK